jgi:ribosome biogenesis protein Nip4
MENITDNQQTDFVNSSNYVEEVLRVISIEALKQLINSDGTRVYVVDENRSKTIFSYFCLSDYLIEAIGKVAGTGQIFIVNKDLNILIHYDCVDNKTVALNLP